ncbi:hypothetical protein [uncultured Massilia sp.]|uniref:hypothetical protein n=1 Tax=uncultured Massilia sp. TaxID=169973 RepID=UPI002590A4E7|nr:hypothetical protein [uncultured Massilia sp.]
MALLRALRAILFLLLPAFLPAYVYAQSTAELAELRAREAEAEARQAIAEAERAELMARLPPAQSKALGGSTDTRQFGAAGLVRAVDLARALATEVCAHLPAGRAAILHDPAASQGMVAARTVDSALARLSGDMADKNKELQRYLDLRRPPGTGIASLPLGVLAAVPATLRAGADIAALLRSDVSASGSSFGEGTRALFASALAQACPRQLAGLGAGYLGELDWARYDKLLGRVASLAGHRAAYAQRIAELQALLDGAKGDQKRDMAAVNQAALAQLKVVDAFIDSLKAGEASEKSPLFNAARYLGYSERTAGALVLDAELRLEGLSIVKQHLFGSQQLRLSGVAILWYRLHEPDGRLLRAEVLRRVSAPVEVDLRGARAADDFWSGK